MTMKIKDGDFATAHIHWAKDGVDWVDIGGTGEKFRRYNSAKNYPAGSQLVTTEGGFHSQQDMKTIPGVSMVVGRATSTYFTQGMSSYSYISPDPFVRFFLFPWSW